MGETTKAGGIKLAEHAVEEKWIGNRIAEFETEKKTLPSDRLARKPLTDCPSLKKSDLASGGSSLKV